MPNLLDMDFLGLTPGDKPTKGGPADLLSIFSEKPSGTLEVHHKSEEVKKPAIATTVQPRTVIEKGKYAALDLVGTGPVISNNVYNIYNNVNMNITAGNLATGFSSGAYMYGQQPEQMHAYLPRSDEKFKEVLPKDF